MSNRAVGCYKGNYIGLVIIQVDIFTMALYSLLLILLKVLLGQLSVNAKECSKKIALHRANHVSNNIQKAEAEPIRRSPPDLASVFKVRSLDTRPEELKISGLV